MLSKINKNSQYILLVILFITPLTVTIGNIVGLNHALIWFIPNFLMFYISLKAILVNIKNIRKKEYILLVLYIAIVFISCLKAKNVTEALLGGEYRIDGFINILSYVGFFYCGTKLKNEQKLKKIMNIMIFSATIISIFCLLKSDITYYIFNIKKEDYYFYVGPFSQFNHFGYYLLIVNICVTNMFISEKKPKKYIYFILHVILLYTLVINDTFGVYLAYLFVLIIELIYFIIKKQKIKEMIILFLTFIVLSFITTRDGFNIVYRNINGLANDTDKIMNSTVEEIYTIGTNRGELWLKGIELIIEKPIFGYGLENTKYEYHEKNIEGSKPHNIILELSLNSGVPSMILYFYLIILIIKKKIKNILKLNNIQLMSLIVIIGYLASSMFGNQVFNVAPYFYIFLGILAQNYYKDKENEI